jgi:hypothetical protein
MQSDSVCASIMPPFLTSRSSASIRATIAHFPQPISDTGGHCGRYTQRAVNLDEVVREVRTFYQTQTMSIAGQFGRYLDDWPNQG